MTADVQTQSAPTDPSDTFRGHRVVLSARGIVKSFGGNRVLDGADLDLHEREVVLLRGANGSGKTTLLNILTGNLEPDAGEINYTADDTPRTYSFPRRWWQDLNPFDHFKPEFVAQEGIGRTWQDVRLFPSLSLRDNIAVAHPRESGENPLIALLPERLATKSSKRSEADADTLLARLGLGGREFSSADMVSLGQSKRVAIARAISAGARVLFLDEPLAGLDRKGIDDILALLESLVREHDITLVIVEHVFNQPHLHGLVNTDWLLEAGKLHRNGKAKSRFPHAHKQPGQGSGGDRPEWFHLLAGDDATVSDKSLPRGALLTRISHKGGAHSRSQPVLEVRDLVVFRGSRPVVGLDEQGEIQGLNFSIAEGDIAIIQAPNGWGKSTLFACICGQVPLTGGAILMEGEDIGNMKTWQRARLGLVACPSLSSLFPTLKIRDIGALCSAQENLESDVPGLLGRQALELSGGENQRTAISLLNGIRKDHPRGISMLDEPFAMLDRNATESVSQAIACHHQSVLIFLPTTAH